MKYLFIIYLLLGGWQLQAIAQTKPKPETISWDTWGVSHITATTTSDLFFAQGWAQMEAHANLILRLYGQARGRGSEYWGSEYWKTDSLVHVLNFPGIVEGYRKSQSPELKTILQSFANGMNAYAAAHPEAIDQKYRVVLPVTADDMNLQSLWLFVMRFIAGESLNTVTNWSETGSNAMAIGPNRSASKNAMLVMNPHLPWGNEYTFFENELILNGNPIYGAQLVGLPGVAIAFNQYLGWTHTNNTLDNADTFELTLKDNGYLIDGKVQPFESRQEIIRVKQADGSMITKRLTVYNSAYGTILQSGKKKALAIKAAGMNNLDALLEWWKMANSHNFGEFEAALKMMQIPFWNVLYADKQGNTFYLFNGNVPRRNYGTYYDWNRTIESTSSKDIWDGYLTYDELPKLKNPKSGWLQNINDPPWTVTFPRELIKDKYPAYIAPEHIDFRTQRAMNMLMGDSDITFDHLVDYKLSTHVEMADRVLPDLLSAIDSTSSPLLQEAKQVLTKWDRKADNDSRGMVLFYLWAMPFMPGNDYNYAVGWDAAHPNTTPYGIRDKQRALDVLEKAAKLIKSAGADLSVPWGTYLRVRANGIDLPANGSLGALGVFRVADGEYGGRTETVNAGDSWVGIVEFGQKVHAKVLLSYGNSSQPGSVHNGDQLKLFSEKQLRDAWFYPEQLIGHIDFTETRVGNIFTKKNYK